MKYFYPLHTTLPSTEKIDLSSSEMEAVEKKWSSSVLYLSQAERLGFSICPTIVVSKDFVSNFFAQKNVSSLLKRESKNLQVDDPSFHQISKSIRQSISRIKLNSASRKELIDSWERMSEVGLAQNNYNFNVHISTNPGHDLLFTCHDFRIDSYEDLEKGIIDYLALQFEDSVLHFRCKETGQYLPKPFNFLIQIVPKHISNGVGYTFDLDNYLDENTITVLARHGQSFDLVDIDHGDRFKIDKKSLILLARFAFLQKWGVNHQKKHSSLSSAVKEDYVLDDQKVILLARKIKIIQSIASRLLKVCWAWTGQRFVLLSIEPVDRPVINVSGLASSQSRPILMGKPGVIGISSGPVKIIEKSSDKLNVQKGDIVVVRGLVEEDKDWIYKVGGIISEAGGFGSIDFQLCSKYSTELVLACFGAMAYLKNGQLVTINGSSGLVYSGVIARGGALDLIKKKKDSLITGTRVFALMNESEVLNPSDISFFDGVGLLRAEHLLSIVGLHQEDLVRRKMNNEYVEMVVEHLLPIVQMAYPKTVVYQMHDLETSLVEGGIRGFSSEKNPKLGCRGAIKYINNPEIFELEVAVVDQFIKMGYSNFGLMIPMLRTKKEGEEIFGLIKQIMKDDYEKVSIWVKCETPAMLLSIQKIFDLPVSGICFDVNEIGQLMLGYDYGNARIGHHFKGDFDILEEALSVAISKCRKAGVSTSIVSENIELMFELVETAVRSGLTGLIVPPDIEIQARHMLTSIERRMSLDHLVSELND